VPTRIVPVGSSVGLHARPAAVIAAKAAELGSDITLWVEGEEEPVDAGSALMIMTLGAEQGTDVTVEGEDAAHVDAIAELVAQDLDA
jgi:phosphocarrier protein